MLNGWVFSLHLILLQKIKRKVQFFLSVIGAATYKVLRDLVAPDKPGSKT